MMDVFRHLKGRLLGMVRHRHKKWAVRRLQRTMGDACTYCGCGFTQDGKRQRTVDHRIPRALGGKNRLANFLLACLACNNRKGTVDEATFRASEWLARRRIDVAREGAA